MIARLAKTAQKNENKVVKAAVVEESYGKASQEAFVAYLKRAQQDLNSMVHSKRRSVVEEQGFLATIKVGDWVDIEQDYSTGITSDGGIGCVYGLHTEQYGEPLQARTVALDVHYIIDNRKERGVDLKRCVVIPMPYKADKVSLRMRKKSRCSCSTSSAAGKNATRMVEIGFTV